ncbi:MAG: iron chelate uptake ABC transporter family permease subunit [Planctomycetota bacterium]|nr:iron chelate uptake ABC transporter family permease subunit [Planctomycetota bacterium]
MLLDLVSSALGMPAAGASAGGFAGSGAADGGLSSWLTGGWLSTPVVVGLGTGLLGLASGLVSPFAVLRGRSLVTDAVAHAALPGICIAFLLVGERNFAALLGGALVIGLLAAGTITLVHRFTRVKEDAATAMVIACYFGLGIVLSSIIQDLPGNKAGLDGFIFGKAASMTRSDLMLIGGVALACIAVISLLYKEFKLLAFDRAFAQSQGWPTTMLDLGVMALVCACTVVGLPAVGIVLMVALLITPAVAARFWSDRLATIVLLSGAFGAVAGAGGTTLSTILPAPPAAALSRGWPTGPMIILTASLLMLASLLLAPRRGLIARALQRARRFSDPEVTPPAPEVSP